MKERHMKKSQRQLGILEPSFLLVLLSIFPCLILVAGLEAQDDVEENLIERLEGTIPYDEITVKADDDTTEVIQLELLDVPERRTPELKTSGKLEIRLLGNPDDVYEVFWRNIVKIRLYEDILIDEVNSYIDGLKFDEAFDYLLCTYRLRQS